MTRGWLAVALFAVTAWLGTAVAGGAAADARDLMTPDQALRAAVVEGDTAGAVEALDAGADPDHAVDGATVLHVAARQGDPSIVRLLLSADADLYARTPDGELALELAIRARRGDAAAVLIEAAGPCRLCRPR
ncbi:ankyrin repeat domain-containing protein [Demequina lignilytica]|uniref:Ankyrin repeat domain-containing protein n=1 Tax=Demequina lignilytica TaxID=3051663 RepID=A0AB35MJ94_9MICO|nr:ankyrin repeat domain-containing protein [Demequina sp. SYSU T0a273]MDN4483861.1 ankyrin repeat domain-containing protein [Demequina sp. SYSU T0a273]